MELDVLLSLFHACQHTVQRLFCAILQIQKNETTVEKTVPFSGVG